MLPYFPFPHDDYDLAMNARALEPDCLIEVDRDAYTLELALKERILAANYGYYCQLPPQTEVMQWEALDLLLTNMARHHPAHFALEVDGQHRHWVNRLLGTAQEFTMGDPASLPLPPLDWLGRQTQEDLLLLSGDACTPLVAGHLCFPSVWSLGDKLGKSFLAIHDEVPFFHERIGQAADLMMQRLKPGRPAGRVNWTIATTDRLDLSPRTRHEWLRTRRGITAHNAGTRLFLRLERQTFSRLPATNGILFTIHTYRAPIATVVDDPERARLLTGAIKGLPRPVREYKGMSGYVDALVTYLEARCRAHANAPRTTASRTGEAEAAPARVHHARGDDGVGDGDGDGAWEEWPLPGEDVFAGDPSPRVYWIRRGTPDEPLERVGIWEARPGRFRLPITARVTCHVQAGRAVVVTDAGERLALAAGDVAIFPLDTVLCWEIVEPLRLLFVASA